MLSIADTRDINEVFANCFVNGVKVDGLIELSLPY